MREEIARMKTLWAAFAQSLEGFDFNYEHFLELGKLIKALPDAQDCDTARLDRIRHTLSTKYEGTRQEEQNAIAAGEIDRARFFVIKGGAILDAIKEIDAAIAKEARNG